MGDKVQRDKVASVVTMLRRNPQPRLLLIASRCGLKVEQVMAIQHRLRLGIHP